MAAGAALARRVQPRRARAAGAAIAARCSGSSSTCTSARVRRVCSATRSTSARVAVVGGGLFPRTALVLRRAAPAADVTIVDSTREHLEIARAVPADRACTSARAFDPADSRRHRSGRHPAGLHRRSARDLRAAAGAGACSSTTGSGRRGRASTSVIVSWLLLKRLNLITLVRALSLTAVLVLAKTLSLAGRDLPWSLLDDPGVLLARRGRRPGVLAARSAAAALRRWRWAPYAADRRLRRDQRAGDARAVVAADVADAARGRRRAARFDPALRHAGEPGGDSRSSSPRVRWRSAAVPARALDQRSPVDSPRRRCRAGGRADRAARASRPSVCIATR